jgi:amidohydrolase
MFDHPFAPSVLDPLIDAAAQALEPKLLAWRRDVHQHPELGNREFRTAALVAEHLKALGLDVVALRADMDALPVSEEVDVPFRSQEQTRWNGEDVGVMHACGHDCHVAILMCVAEVLVGLRGQLRGSVKFIFQPAEELPPEGEEGGAALMVKEGALENPVPRAIVGLHVVAGFPSGVLGTREGPAMASADRFHIEIEGRQTHGAMPWRGVDPIVTSAQVVLGLQTIVSRTQDLTHEPAVVTVGMIRGGNRENIIPERVELRGTIRSFDEAMRDDIHERVTTLAEAIGRGSRATCRVCIRKDYPVTINDPALTRAARPVLERVAALAGTAMIETPKATGSEDFSFFQRVVPGLFFVLGVTPKDQDPKTAAPNHSPRFFVDEAALVTGVRAMAKLAVAVLEN